MRSIRNRITIWLLVGLALLWVAGGTVIYLSSHAAMLASIDKENQGWTRQVRSQSRGSGGGRSQWHQDGAADQPAIIPAEVYYQVRTLEGETLLRSENLGERDLPMLDVTGESASFATAELEPGRSVRVAATQFAAGRGGGRREGRGAGGGGGGMNEPVHVAVARDLADLEAESRRLLWWLGAIGLAAALATYLLLTVALRHGLRPLRKLSEAVAGIDASSLDARFGAADMPHELKPIAARLDALMGRLEESFHRERRFSADLAHELRTPIAELQVMADLSLEWPAERTEQQMRDIRSVAGRMHGVVDTLLQLARLEGEGDAMPREPVALAGILDKAWQSNAALAGRRGLQVQFDWPEDATMPGCPELWQHLLGNLLANAAEYATAGGRLAVEAGEASIRVLNSAHDLDREQVGQMFDRFWRGDKSRTGAVHSGLGLALAKACAEAMGLQIAASLGEDADGKCVLAIEVVDPPQG